MGMYFHPTPKPIIWYIFTCGHDREAEIASSPDFRWTLSYWCGQGKACRHLCSHDNGCMPERHDGRIVRYLWYRHANKSVIFFSSSIKITLLSLFFRFLLETYRLFCLASNLSIGFHILLCGNSGKKISVFHSIHRRTSSHMYLMQPYYALYDQRTTQPLQ